MLQVRRFQVSDSAALAQVFFDAVQIGAAADYNQAQRDAWCATRPPDDWAVTRFAGLTTFVAVTDRAVGFMNMDGAGYVDMAFVSPDAQRQGVARALLSELEHHAKRQVLRRCPPMPATSRGPFLQRRAGT